MDSVYVLTGGGCGHRWLETADVQVKRHRKEDKTGHVATDVNVKAKPG